jgi:hypothetical protein
MYFITAKKILPKHISGMALWPVILIRDRKLLLDPIFINHERIHFRQQGELLLMGFYIWYGLEFLVRWICCRNVFIAYKNISFEREAYIKENDLQYLIGRKGWSFLKFL